MDYQNYFDHDDALAYAWDLGARGTAALIKRHVQPGSILEVGPGMHHLYDDSDSVDLYGVPTYRMDFCSMPTVKRYDNIVMSHVLEHIESDYAAIRKAYELLNVGGRLIVLAPRGDICTNKEVLQNGHIRRYDMRRIQCLESINFTCTYAAYVHSVHNFVWNRLKFFLKAVNKPIRMVDGRSIYERDLYRILMPLALELLDRIDAKYHHKARGGNMLFVLTKLA